MTKRNSASTALALDDPDVLEIIFTYLPLEALLRTRPVNHDFAIAGRSRLIQIYRIISGGFDILQERAFSKLREIWNKRVIFTGKEETAMIQLCDCLLGRQSQLTDLYVYPCCRSDTVTALARACIGRALVHLQVSLPPPSPSLIPSYEWRSRVSLRPLAKQHWRRWPHRTGNFRTEHSRSSSASIVE